MADYNTRELMAQSKFFESYSRFIESEGRYETWAESVERVMATHRIKYKKQLASLPALTALFDEVQQAYTERLVLGSQRALQFGGEQLLKHEFRLYNCVKKTTRFVTSEGIKSFEDFSDGDRIVVLTHTGKWKPAIVRSYGQQSLNEITLERNSVQKKVFATENHRWILNNGDTTEDLKIGDRLIKEPNIFGDFCWSEASPEEQLYWKVISIHPSTTEQVWCLDVEDDHSFVLEGGIVTGNCLGGHANNVNWFGEYFYLLLCGCGVGASVQKHHVAQLPMIRPRTKQAKTHVVEDSIEGWATAVDVLMSSFFMGGGKYPEYEGRKVFFDTTRIRDKGAHISGGFKAPGPEPLQHALNQIERLLVSIAEEGILRPIHVYDIGMWIADAVLSGGVRRAATIFLFSKDDLEMMNAKIGDWFVKNPQRARSNNSAVCLRSELTEDEFKELIGKTKEFGEPGFVFVDDIEHCFNPCVTGDTLVDTSEGLRYVKDLIGLPFKAIVDGQEYDSAGFWSTGKKKVYEVKTKRGYTIKATDNHKILIQREKERIWVEVKDAKLGDMMVINKNNECDFEIDAKDFDKGWLVGEVIGDGCHNPKKYPTLVRFWGNNAKEMADLAVSKINKICETGQNRLKSVIGVEDQYTVGTTRLGSLCESFITAKDKNLIEDNISSMSNSFICGLMRGWFDADGTVLFTETHNSRSIRLSSNNLKRLKLAQILLTKIGIASTIYEMRQKPHSSLGYDFKAVHELHIGRDGIDRFENYIGFYDENKSSKLRQIQLSKKKSTYNDKFLSEIVSIDYVGKENVYDCTVKDVHCFSANGLIVHNCLEIGFYPISASGEHGFQSCNLVEMNGNQCDTAEDFYRACRVAAILGTIQAGYTNFKFVSPATKEIIEREALLGVSLTGWLNNPKVLLDPEVMRKGAEIVKATNKEVAAMLGINQAARTTCVKPAGNASVLLGTASGVHPEHSKRYLRTVQMNKIQEVAEILRATNSYMVEDSVWSQSKSDYSISFPIIAPKGSTFKKDINAIAFLDIIKSIQVNWVEAGTNHDLCVSPKVRHNVSNTVTVRDEEWPAVIDYIYANRDYFTGISLLSSTGSKDYHQAPYNEVYTESEIVKMYGPAALFASGLIVDAVKGFSNLWEACSVAISPTSDMSNQEIKDTRSDWIRRFHKFAVNHFNGDLKQTSYCLKDVYLLYRWQKIQQNFVDPDLEGKLKVAKAVDIDTMGAISCSGTTGCEF